MLRLSCRCAVSWHVYGIRPSTRPVRPIAAHTEVALVAFCIPRCSAMMFQVSRGRGSVSIYCSTLRRCFASQSSSTTLFLAYMFTVWWCLMANVQSIQHTLATQQICHPCDCRIGYGQSLRILFARSAQIYPPALCFSCKLCGPLLLCARVGRQICSSLSSNQSGMLFTAPFRNQVAFSAPVAHAV